jgi:hypothetical protein
VFAAVNDLRAAMLDHRYCRIIGLLLTVTFFAALAQGQQWNWAVDAGGGGNTDFCYDIATDSQGNAYWVGSVSGTAAFGCATVNAANTVSGIIAKYAPDGSCIWVRSINTSFYDAWVYGVAIDDQDRIYITGSCQGTTDFGNDIVLSGSGSLDDWFTARYDTGGNCIWADRIANSPGTSEGRGIALDDEGGIYVTGFAGSSGYSFGDVVVNNGGFTRQAVIVKYDSTGTAQWARSTNGTTGGRSSARGIAVVGDRLYITGQVYFATAGYQGLPITSTNTTSHAFVLACDLEGEPLWARSYGGGDNEGFAVAADSLGNLFMTGRMWGSLYLPDDTLASVSNDDDALFMGLSSEGTLRWAKTIGSDERDIGWSAVCDGKGNAYFSTHFNNTVDAFGTSVTALGGEDALILKVEQDGDLVWAARPSGFQRDIPLAIHRKTVAPYELYFGGYYSGPITYGGTTIDDDGNADAMMVMGVDTTFHVSTNVQSVCPGECNGEAFAFVNGEVPLSYLWSTGATSQAITGLCEGEYVVEVTDANGVTFIDSVRVAPFPDPEFAIQQENDSIWIEGGVEWLWSYEGQVITAGEPFVIAEANGTYQVEYIDDNGCSWMTEPVAVVLNVGIEGSEPEGIRLFPNPANDICIVSGISAPIVGATAMDVLGRSAQLSSLASNALDVRSLAPGAWTILLETVFGLEVVRFIKE